MMRISPMCWIFGHSRAIRIVLDHKRFGVTQTRVTTVKVLCDRCGEDLHGRVRSLTHSFPPPSDFASPVDPTGHPPAAYDYSRRPV